MIKLLIYPFIAAKVAAEMVFETGRSEIRKAMQFVLIDTLADTREINELKAELAVLRAEVSEIKYKTSQNGERSKVRAT